MDDLFYHIVNTSICNFADGSAPYACNTDLLSLLCYLESDILSAIAWFDMNYIQLNQVKYHFLIAGNTPEHL